MEQLEKKPIEVPSEKPLVVVGIPAFNEERTIAKVVLQARKLADLIVVCDDGSRDMTGETAESLGAAVVRHERNMGYGAAIQSIFRKARKLNCDILVTLDGDGQHYPEEISALLMPILDGKADVVTGSRFVGSAPNGNNHIPRHRRFGIRAISKLARSASKCDVSDAQNGFRAYNKTALEKLSLGENGMGVSVEILVRARQEGLRVAEVPSVCNYEDVEEPSTHNSLKHGTDVVMSLVRLIVEEHPLMFLAVPGAASLLVGVLFGVWMLQIYTIEHRIVTNIALASMAFTLLGFFAISIATTFYAIARLRKRLNSLD